MKFVPVEKMRDRRVVVICNMKPAKMRDIMSYGMVRSYEPPCKHVMFCVQAACEFLSGESCRRCCP